MALASTSYIAEKIVETKTTYGLWRTERQIPLCIPNMSFCFPAQGLIEGLDIFAPYLAKYFSFEAGSNKILEKRLYNMINTALYAVFTFFETDTMLKFKIYDLSDKLVLYISFIANESVYENIIPFIKDLEVSHSNHFSPLQFGIKVDSLSQCYNDTQYKASLLFHLSKKGIA
jgi:hypothetical protein